MHAPGTVDINNTPADVEAVVDMSSENPLTVTLSVSSLNLNREATRTTRTTRRVR